MKCWLQEKVLCREQNILIIDIKYHVSREAVANGEIVVKHVSTHDQLADALTKNLGPRKFVLMLSGLVCEVSDA